MKVGEVKIGDRIKSKYDGRIGIVKKRSEDQSGVFSIVFEDNGGERKVHCHWLIKFNNSGGSKKIMWGWLG